MDLDTLVGAKLALGFPGTDIHDDTVTCLQETRAQSLVVFSRNFSSPEHFYQLIQRLTQAVGRRLLVMVDHEGGRVIRLSGGMTRFPDAATVGRTQQAADVERQGRVEAQELARLGVRVNLAPCVDVIEPGCDPVIGDRSYGSDPERVSQLAVARIRGLQAGGVAACAKHFPGLGAVPRDPHQLLPTIGLDWPAMERSHLKPFAAAIEAEVAMIMSSHVCYPGLGEAPDLPATFSPRLIRELLRKRMRFPGLIVTDDLEMGALSPLGTMGERAVRATEAGHDLLLICSNLEAAHQAATALREAYRNGRLSRTELEESATRVAHVREKFLG
ncbi:MAG: beta-N-acetylhexosaminidase [Candidatus Omnitrophica bacterium]|nr:beta-N-acetylhexosaminidase [Candidatus Omnitrophota bacterium]